MCVVDLAHDPKAYPAEQVTRDGPVERKEEGRALRADWHLVAVSGHQYHIVYAICHTLYYMGHDLGYIGGPGKGSCSGFPPREA